MPKTTQKHIYSALELRELGFAHQYDFTDNQGTSDEFSYSVYKLDLNEEAYLECTIEFRGNERHQYFSLQAEEFNIKKPVKTEEIKFLKKLFKP